MPQQNPWHSYYRPQSCGGVSGGGTTAGPGSSHPDLELITPHSLSFAGPFHFCFLSLCMYITRITFNPSSSCSYFLLPPASQLGPWLRLIYSFRTLAILNIHNHIYTHTEQYIVSFFSFFLFSFFFSINL